VFLDDAVQCFARESGEVDGYVVALEGLLDEWPDADRGGGEDTAGCGVAVGLAACVEEFGCGGVEELFGGIAGEHAL
jgi:hypothetical protein